jgi:hypothetical protein
VAAFGVNDQDLPIEIEKDVESLVALLSHRP